MQCEPRVQVFSSSSRLMWFESAMSPQDPVFAHLVCTLGPWLVVPFRKVVEALGGRALLMPRF